MNTDIKSTLLRNTKLVVSLASGSNFEYYDSRIEDINDDSIYISMPTKRGIPVQVQKSSVLNVSALVANGRVTFNSRIRAVVKDPIYMLAIEMPDDLRHEQLRQFYRVPVHLKVKFYMGDMDTLEAIIERTKRAPFHGGLVDDLSGGGCKLITTAEVHDGNIVVVDFSDTAVDGVGLVECKAVRVIPAEAGRRSISLRYWGIDESSRDRIVRYVFRRQMELRQMNAE